MTAAILYRILSVSRRRRSDFDNKIELKENGGFLYGCSNDARNTIGKADKLEAVEKHVTRE